MDMIIDSKNGDLLSFDRCGRCGFFDYNSCACILFHTNKKAMSSSPLKCSDMKFGTQQGKSYIVEQHPGELGISSPKYVIRALKQVK